MPLAHEQGGAVVLMRSGAGSTGFPALSIYSAAKVAIRSFFRRLNTDLKSRGIRVNTVSSSMALTPAMQTYRQNNDGVEDWIKQTFSFGRLGRTEEIAKAVLFLAFDENSFVGQKKGLWTAASSRLDENGDVGTL